VKRSSAAALAVGALGVLVASCGSDKADPKAAVAAAPALKTPMPKFDPTNFAREVTNPWWPLKPGTVYHLRGHAGKKRARVEFSVTRKTKRILGIDATVVLDRTWLDGKLEEATYDWYAQDRAGNVWYLGEDTMEYDSKGRVKTTAGSWQAGVDGARPGLFMPAQPRVGQEFRQEYYRGQAEDQFRIVSLSAPVKVPYVSARSAMRTRESNPLEPGLITTKYFVRGIGRVLEATGGDEQERFELESLTRG
jgi:hypothetical protein